MGTCKLPNFKLFPLGVGYLKYIGTYGRWTNFQLLRNKKTAFVLFLLGVDDSFEYYPMCAKRVQIKGT